MIRLNKKQINGILKLLKSIPCQSRPALQTMRIKKDGFAYITNGFIVIRFKLELEPEPIDDNQEEFIITKDNLEKWYKSARSYDYLDETSILELQDKENTTIYPDMSKLFKEHLSTPSDNKICIDTNLLKLFDNISGYYGVTLVHYKNCVHIQSIKYPSIDGIIMELNR